MNSFSMHGLLRKKANKMPSRKSCVLLVLSVLFVAMLYRHLCKNIRVSPSLEELNTYTLLPSSQNTCTNSCAISHTPVSLQTFVQQIKQHTNPEISCITLKEKSGLTKQLTVFKNIPTKEILGPRIIL